LVAEPQSVSDVQRRHQTLASHPSTAFAKRRQVAADLVALALGDAYQRAILGIDEEGDGEALHSKSKLL
jgi:hypothetical protein